MTEAASVVAASFVAESARVTDAAAFVAEAVGQVAEAVGQVAEASA